MLEIHDISTYYGHIQALKGVSLEIDEGEIVSLIGANGAGKTTLLNSISGIVPPRLGAILLDGQDITCLPSEARRAKEVHLKPHFYVVTTRF